MGDDGLDEHVLRRIVSRFPDAAVLVDETETVVCTNALADTLLSAGIRSAIELTRTALAGDGLTLVVLRDVTERNALLAQARSTERLHVHGALAAEIAHELASPLNTLGFALEVFGSEDAHARVRALEDARIASRHMLQLLADLRVVGLPHDQLGVVDIPEVVEISLRLASSVLRESVVLPQLSLRAEQRVRGSRGALVQVVTNLVVNAAHALRGARGSRVVRVETSDGDGWVTLEVIDAGVGIAPSVLARVFDTGFTTKPRGVGAGLGLGICKNLVEGLGGDIVLSSELGVGTCARVRLPIADAAALPVHVRGPDDVGA